MNLSKYGWNHVGSLSLYFDTCLCLACLFNSNQILTAQDCKHVYTNKSHSNELPLASWVLSAPVPQPEMCYSHVHWHLK